MRQRSMLKRGYPERKRPSAKMIAARRKIELQLAVFFESVIETPTMKRKNGKMRSVGVQPCQAACSSGQYTFPQSPGLLTMTIPAIVSPRKTSSDTRRVSVVMTADTI